MNKYFVKIPYSYTQYAELTGFIYAEDEEEAEELACDSWNIHEEDYIDKDSSGDSDYDYDDMDVTLEESDVPSQNIPSLNNSTPYSPVQPDLPNYYLEDLPALKTL